MEIANLTVAIAPPTFTQGTEEARKDSLSREAIPQPKNSQESSKEGRAGSESTSGTNSSLYAQSQSLIRNATDQEKNREKEEQKKDKKNPKEVKGRGTIAPTNSLQPTISNGPIKILSNTFIPTAQSSPSKTSLGGNVQREGIINNMYAKFSSSLKNKLTQHDQIRLTTVTQRYNASARVAQLGTIFDEMV